MKNLIGFTAFMAIWIFGCYMADYVFKFQENAWSMSWGLLIGLLAMESWKGIKGY